MHVIEDEQGDAVAAEYFCSDSCHRQWCEREGLAYGGWFGCQESGVDQWCAECGVRCDFDHEGVCDGSCLPVVVNLAYPRDRESFCAHGIADSLIPGRLHV